MNERSPMPQTAEEKLKEWGPGPWVDEPNRLEFYAHGLPCLLRRTELGNWCGYVAVPPGHPFHGKGYDDAAVDAHGGLTYAHDCQGEICHVPREGESDNVWWLGFDCGHYMDVIPGTVKVLEMARQRFKDVRPEVPEHRRFEEYRDIEYVRAETESLAKQLAEAAVAPP